jgi:Zn finger protein HypA/HybF involved in hydrogenase expression
METAAIQNLVAGGATLREIADALGVHTTTARRRLKRVGLATDRATFMQISTAAREAGLDELEWSCRKHGQIVFRRDVRGTYRCPKCNGERVSARRRAIKQTLVADAGGICAICGYDRCVRALGFHHVDPSAKEFSVAARGHARSLKRARAEAAKCVLLCANCHMEVEAGLTALPG